MIEQKESSEEYYYIRYSELINPWYTTHLNKMGLFNTGYKAEGATITDSKGNVYIDCTAGYGMGNLGHNNPQVIKGIIDQLNRNEVNTRPFINKIQIELAELLKEISPGKLECSYLLNSGSEAIESALKLVRLYKGSKTIISMEHSFHGHTLGALSASGIPSFKKSFQPLIPGFKQVAFGDYEALKKTCENDVAAILIEPIQHDAGVIIPSKEYLKRVRELCDEKNILLIFDEVITGIGKTGFMFASEYFDIEPDILVIGKSLGAGLIPIGAVLARKNLWQRFGLSFPMSATSYGGNAIACRTAIETINFIRSNDILSSIKRKEKILSESLNYLLKINPDLLLSVDGIGLLFGIEALNKNIASEIVREMIKKKVIVYQSFGNPAVIMLEPPLVISEKQLMKVVGIFAEVIAKIKLI